ncbi:hypothetical protein [Paraburkholderia saeva]|uniref:hypothetical protein n=1 Tax=Paraburkholderia saeva TaxID=2777537 RepID=UPI001DDA2D55|nr:hypothetical protein [Paraburkholderia saeva]CAG4916121.1 hypothetical protein R70241_04416 [Paraburkholderia saeva]
MKLLEGDYHLSPVCFSNPSFIQENRPFFEKYVDLRVKGFGGNAAFNRAFGPCLTDLHSHEIALATERIERTHYYVARFDKRSAEMPIDEMWTLRDCLEIHLSIVHDEHAKGHTRIQAARELDDLTGSRLKVGKLLKDLAEKKN